MPHTDLEVSKTLTDLRVATVADVQTTKHTLEGSNLPWPRNEECIPTGVQTLCQRNYTTRLIATDSKTPSSPDENGGSFARPVYGEGHQWEGCMDKYPENNRWIKRKEISGESKAPTNPDEMWPEADLSNKTLDGHGFIIDSKYVSLS